MFFVPTVGFSSGYVAQPAHFDGIVDYLTRGAGFSGAVDSGIFTLSFWINPSIDSTRQWIFAGAQALAGGSYRGIVVEKSATNGIRVYGYNAGVTSILQCNIPDSSVLAAGGWKHVLMSFDLSNVAKRFIYLNDVAQSVTYTTYTNGTLDFTLLDWSIAAMASGIEDYTGDIADLWFSPGLYLDLSVTANRRNFINANGKPVFLGINGQLPTGGAPLVFMSQTSSSNDWITNKGGGGGYTTHGTITRSQTSPSNGYTPPAYIAEPVFFDGTNDYLTRGATITGAADSKIFTMSFWLNLQNADGTLGTVLYNATTLAGSTTRFFVRRENTLNHFQFAAYNAAGTLILYSVPLALLSTNGWAHFLISVDLADTGKRHLYLDDTSVPSWGTYTNDTIDFTVADWAIGAGPWGGDKLVGDVADLWFQPGVYIDFSVVANRRKFIDASGNPVNLGEYGEIPTGTRPILFTSGAIDTWHTNDGSGGGFTLHGEVLSSLSSPSPGYAITEAGNILELVQDLSLYPDSGGVVDGGPLYINGEFLAGFDYVIKDGPINAGYGDSYTKLLLHGDGTDGSTTITDSSASSHTVTKAGNIQIDTAESTFGGASMYFDGTGDYLTLDGSSDFGFGTGDWTIDFWMRLGASATQIFYDFNPAGTSGSHPYLYVNSNHLTFSTSGNPRITGTATLTTGVWYHVATVYSAGATKLYVNGVLDGTYNNTENYLVGASRPSIGVQGTNLGSFPFTGWIDEFRVSKGIARWTANFTPPTQAYPLPEYFTDIADSRSSLIVIKGDLTIPSGVVFTPSVRKLFTTVYVTGNCAINGELSMTARGANHSATGAGITAAAIRLATGTYSSVVNPQIPAAGGAGAPLRIADANPEANVGTAGTAGSAGGTGGGGSGGAFFNTGGATATSGAGATGTCFSGGSGGGGAIAISSGSGPATAQGGFADGGAGGYANASGGGSSSAGGGAGNPAGVGDIASGSTIGAASDGTGGCLILMVGATLSGTGTITANGAASNPTGAATYGVVGGGGSGGGSVTVFYGADTSSITPAAAGGAAGVGDIAAHYGGAGGAGTARKLSIIQPGSMSFTASGSFQVPAYNTMTVTLWGGGGGGGSGGIGGAGSGSAGGQSKFNATTPLIANGGTGGGKYDGSNGSGGTASGGDTNTTGSGGSQPNGGAGAGPGGGAGGGTDANGTIPGGGGGGGDDSNSSQKGRGGGGGGRCFKTYSAGQLTISSVIAVTVGAGGAGNQTGDGARGQVDISWS